MLKSTENNQNSVSSGSTKWIGRFLLAALLCALAAFCLAAALNCALDRGLLGNADWLQEKHLHYLIGYQMYEQPLGMFVHAAILELSFAVSLAVASMLIDRQLLTDRGFLFVFISFLFYEIPTAICYQIWWAQLGWTNLDILATLSPTVSPLPGALTYAMRLGVIFLVSRYRKLRPWNNLPWWSIFAPTACCLISGTVMFPLCELINKAP